MLSKMSKHKPEDIIINNPDRQRVRFNLVNGSEIEVCIRNGLLKIVSNGRISVLPDSSNSIKINSSSF